MSEQLEISTTTLGVRGPGVTETAYVVRTGETVLHKGTVPGPFDSLDFAHSPGGVAAQRWIDQNGTLRAPGRAAVAR